jgi:hypothetical protein
MNDREDQIQHIAQLHARDIHAALSDAERAACILGDAVFGDYMDEKESLCSAFEFVIGRPIYCAADVDDGLCTQADVESDWDLIDAAIDASNYMIA